MKTPENLSKEEIDEILQAYPPILEVRFPKNMERRKLIQFKNSLIDSKLGYRICILSSDTEEISMQLHSIFDMGEEEYKLLEIRIKECMQDAQALDSEI